MEIKPEEILKIKNELNQILKDLGYEPYLITIGGNYVYIRYAHSLVREDNEECEHGQE